MRVLLLPLSTALAVRTIECTNHSLQRCLSQKEFYREIKNLFMLSVRISSYGCTREVWRARKMRKSCTRR